VASELKFPTSPILHEPSLYILCICMKKCMCVYCCCYTCRHDQVAAYMCVYCLHAIFMHVWTARCVIAAWLTLRSMGVLCVFGCLVRK
jgi:hypothetical protein